MHLHINSDTHTHPNIHLIHVRIPSYVNRELIQTKSEQTYKRSRKEENKSEERSIDKLRTFFVDPIFYIFFCCCRFVSSFAAFSYAIYYARLTIVFAAMK